MLNGIAPAPNRTLTKLKARTTSRGLLSFARRPCLPNEHRVQMKVLHFSAGQKRQQPKEQFTIAILTVRG